MVRREMILIYIYSEKKNSSVQFEAILFPEFQRISLYVSRMYSTHS